LDESYGDGRQGHGACSGDGAALFSVRRHIRGVDFIGNTGAFFDAKPYPSTAYRDRTPLMHEIRRDGLDL
jgi:hypothetical protein